MSEDTSRNAPELMNPRCRLGAVRANVPVTHVVDIEYIAPQPDVRLPFPFPTPDSRLSPRRSSLSSTTAPKVRPLALSLTTH